MQEGPLFSTLSPAFTLCRFFENDHSDWCEIILHCSFNLHFCDTHTHTHTQKVGPKKVVAKKYISDYWYASNLDIEGSCDFLKHKRWVYLKVMYKSLLFEKIQFGYKHLSNVQKAYFRNTALWLMENTPKSFFSSIGVASLMELVKSKVSQL